MPESSINTVCVAFRCSQTKPHNDVKCSSKSCRWTVHRCTNFWCFPRADQICGLLSNRFSRAQSMKNWIKRLFLQPLQLSY